MIIIGGSWDIQVIWGWSSPTITLSVFAECRSQIEKSWNEELFRSLCQSFIMCEMVDLYNSRLEGVEFVGGMKNKYDIENRKRGKKRPGIRVLSGLNIEKGKRISHKW